jgi:hypothetical protein
MSQRGHAFERGFEAALNHNKGKPVDYLWQEFYDDLDDYIKRDTESDLGWAHGDLYCLQEKGALPIDLDFDVYVANMIILKEIEGAESAEAKR